MTKIVDTVPAFEDYGRKAGVESPFKREVLWKDLYQSAHPDVFAAFEAATGPQTGLAALVRELRKVQGRVKEAAPAVLEVVERIDPLIPGALGLPAEPSPVHVVLVGTFATNATVGRLGDDVAVFHCLEWFQSAAGSEVLAAHEGAHAWHQIALNASGPEDDLAWMAFSEGLAIAASRAVAPGHDELDYYWYQHPDVEDWLPWCQENAGELRKHFLASLDIPEAVETFFGGGMVDGHWRVGQFVADELVKSLDRPLPELAAMSIEEGRTAIRDALQR